MSDRSPTADEAMAADAALDTAADTAPVSADADAATPVAPAHEPPPIPVGALAPTADSAAAPTDLQSIETEDDDSAWHDAWEYLPSWLVSTVLHLGLVLLLALVTTLTVVRDTAPPLEVSADSQNFDEGEPEELSADLMASSMARTNNELLICPASANT